MKASEATQVRVASSWLDMPDDAQAILIDLAASVEAHKGFPRRDRFLITQRSRMATFDELERERVIFRWQDALVWSVDGLRSIAGEVAFAKQELARGQSALDRSKPSPRSCPGSRRLRRRGLPFAKRAA